MNVISVVLRAGTVKRTGFQNVNVVQSARSLMMLRRDILPPSSNLKSKPSKASGTGTK
jgi:hypothetical protein